MKKHIIVFLSMLCAFLSVGCLGEKSVQPQTQNAPGTSVSESEGPSPATRGNSLGKVEISFPFTKQDGVASNQFAVWIEDDEGNFVKTLYVTDFTARGGYKNRKESIPTWVKKSNAAETPRADLDAVSGATPQTGNLTYTWDCTDQNGNPVSGGNYRFVVEGTLFWESGVLYSGIIAVDENQKSTVAAVAEYSSEDAKNKNMIGAVTAVYIPEEGTR